MNIKNDRKQRVHDPTPVIDRRLEQIQFRSSMISLFIKIIMISLAVVLVLTVFFGVSIQHGEGMYPRIRDGDIMMYFRLTKDYQVGDIITLTKDGTHYTGRIVAKSGDTVDTSTEGKLIINGAIQYEEIYYETYTQGSSLVYPYTVPENAVFILGDMRTGSKDSRDIGAVNLTDIDGKLITIIRRRGL